MDGRTDTPSYRDATAHLKTKNADLPQIADLQVFVLYEPKINKQNLGINHKFVWSLEIYAVDSGVLLYLQ